MEAFIEGEGVVDKDFWNRKLGIFSLVFLDLVCA
jgi:hypothetical protein